MHGMVFARLKQFVESQISPEAWPALLVEAGIGEKIYLASSTYPDAEIVALVKAASAKTGIAAPALLEAFGEFLVPAYLAMYGHLVKGDWRTLDLVEHTEETIHKVVRVRHQDATPPAASLHTPLADRAPARVRLTAEALRRRARDPERRRRALQGAHRRHRKRLHAEGRAGVRDARARQLRLLTRKGPGRCRDDRAPSAKADAPAIAAGGSIVVSRGVCHASGCTFREGRRTCPSTIQSAFQHEQILELEQHPAVVAWDGFDREVALRRDHKSTPTWELGELS